MYIQNVSMSGIICSKVGNTVQVCFRVFFAIDMLIVHCCFFSNSIDLDQRTPVGALWSESALINPYPADRNHSPKCK